MRRSGRWRKRIEYSVRVVSLIYSKPIDNIRTFADAFKIRKEKE